MDLVNIATYVVGGIVGFFLLRMVYILITKKDIIDD